MPYYMHELNPDYNPATHILRNMSTNELQMMLNENELIETLVQELQQVKSAESERKAMLESNKSLAESNLSKEPLLNELRVKVVEQHKEFKDIKQRLEEKKDKLDQLTRQMSLDTTLALLQAAAAEAEEESEAFSENFLTGEIQVEAFLESYLNKRKLSHLRRVKAEKMAELLRQSGASLNHTPPSTRAGPSSTNKAPYPDIYGPPYRPGASYMLPYPPLLPGAGASSFYPNI